MISHKAFPLPLQPRRLTIFSLFFCCLILLFTAPAYSQKLVILNWNNYLSPALIKRFELENSTQIHQIFFNSDEERTERLLETQGRGYDLVLVAGIDLNAYIRRGWLNKLPTQKISNMKHIDRYWHNRFAHAREYAVPFSWGTLGIIYRSDLVDEPIISWSQLYRPSEKLSGHISMIATPRDLVGMSLKALGYSANSQDPSQLAEAKILVNRQAPHVKTYTYPSLRKDSAILNGLVHAAMVFNGDALTLQRYNKSLVFALPVEGGNLWVDYLTVPKLASSPDLAYKFIDFLNDPHIAAEQAKYSNYATTNQSARTYLPESFLSDPRIYPQGTNFESSESYEHLSPSTLRYKNEILAEIQQ